MKNAVTLKDCPICLSAYSRAHCKNCGAFHVGKWSYSREGKQMVRGIPMPIRVRINRLERMVGQ